VVTQLLAPWPLKFIFDSVLFKHKAGQLVVRPDLAGRSLHLLVLLSIAALGIAIFDAVFTYVDGRATEVVAQRSIYDLRLALFAHLQRLSISFHQHEDTRVGDLLSRLSGDVQALEDLAAKRGLFQQLDGEGPLGRRVEHATSVLVAEVRGWQAVWDAHGPERAASMLGQTVDRVLAAAESLGADEVSVGGESTQPAITASHLSTSGTCARSVTH